MPEAQGGWRLPRASGALGWEPVSSGPMRICRYADGDGVAAGVVEGETVRPLRDTLTPTDVLAMSAAQRSGLSLGDPIALESVRLLVPVQPRAVRDFVGFEQHVAAMVALDGLDRVPDPWYEAPAFYFSNPNALAATGDEIEVPPGCERFDFELEIAAVVGRRVRDLSLQDARGAIAGYAVLNDWSARDLQAFDRRQGMGWSKSKDSATTLGPWVVTADELEPARNADGRLDLAMRVWRNGELLGTDSVANLSWSLEQMLVYASRGTWLEPGDVIGSGTCGYGCLAEMLVAQRGARSRAAASRR